MFTNKIIRLKFKDLTTLDIEVILQRVTFKKVKNSNLTREIIKSKLVTVKIMICNNQTHK
jgi:hypothetical protein